MIPGSGVGFDRMFNGSVGMQVNRMLDALGLPDKVGDMIGAQIDLLGGNPLGYLPNLRDGYNEAAMGRGTSGFERSMMSGGMPSAMPFSPTMMMPMMGPLAGGGYGGFGGFHTLVEILIGT
jgi:hypothetical protein